MCRRLGSAANRRTVDVRIFADADQTKHRAKLLARHCLAAVRTPLRASEASGGDDASDETRDCGTGSHDQDGLDRIILDRADWLISDVTGRFGRLAQCLRDVLLGSVYRVMGDVRRGFDRL